MDSTILLHWLLHLITTLLFLLSQNPTPHVLARYHHYFSNPTTTTATSHSQTAPPLLVSEPSNAFISSSSSSSLPPAISTSVSPTIFDVTTFGAVGDGFTDDTAAFTEAWKAACAVESGLVLVPSGHTFMLNPIVFYGPCQPGLVFQVDGVLMPLNGPESWPESESIEQWLVFYQLDGMRLTGAGTIEGRGQQWWKLPCKPHQGPNGSTLPGPCISPSLLRFFMSSNMVVTKLRINNSPQFHVKFDSCDGVRINGLSISSPEHSPNTDGIHIENTRNVVIHNSVIANGDDCISIGSGTRNVDIKNVTCGPSHGISIGSLGIHNSQACVSNVTVRKSHIKNSDNGLRIKTWQGGSGSVTDVSFHDIHMENVLNCIIIDQYYCLTGDCDNQTMAVQLSDVSYRNIKGTFNPQNPPFYFACSDAMPCTNITLSQVELFPHQGQQWAVDPLCWNAYGTQETLTIPPIHCLLDGEPDTVGEASTHGCY